MPICQAIDSVKADMSIFDSSGIEAFVTRIIREIKQLYINSHFCYVFKFGIVTNGLGIILGDDKPNDSSLPMKYEKKTFVLIQEPFVELKNGIKPIKSGL